MNDLTKIKQIEELLRKLDDSSFLDGIKYDLESRLRKRKEFLESIEGKDICPECRGRGGYLESYNDGLGQRDSDWCSCSKCSGTGYIEKGK